MVRYMLGNNCNLNVSSRLDPTVRCRRGVPAGRAGGLVGRPQEELRRVGVARRRRARGLPSAARALQGGPEPVCG